ncbi:MAG: 50S ribosomal protein L22 [Candidatus Wolfebacteria bacterium GW2011_GWA2_42_10]|uniref:Large ribosomal subunit protein uL22 n=2 Tax=Candidatus Wolfeibacteriota TaxID=1752735 RepID=A0A0G0ZUF1_9BACT|nr:MAG: 50S ribosomal protein L22 [Candidatus Wolfebacteria bacterium GW2011_GWB1_41_12]KKS25616.1 MAG: 50S ribosomal protein L22 [Candidatus Wolfebacteria bacterium GW2011_GWA2_42_10]KKT56493.1 MAG: 50S ribosomal protein L22 [Candidatus Wolfebacteria bacterium GW2011_GWA1_44_24]
MKEQKAQLNYLRMAPRKVRLVANLLKGLSISEAEAQLLINPRKAKEPLLKLLRSAIAAGKEKNLKENNLFVKSIFVDQGPMLKRFMPRAQGRATPIQKKTSHITLILGESEKSKETRFKIVKPEKIKKREAEKIKKEKAEQKQKIEEIKKEAKPQAQGFMRRIFRRKSV